MLGIHDRKRTWLTAWLGGAGIGVANGVLREAALARVIDEENANRISALTAVAARLALTVAFELGFDRIVAKKSWRESGADYDLRRGRLWPVVLASIALGPELARRRSHA